MCPARIRGGGAPIWACSWFRPTPETGEQRSRHARQRAPQALRRRRAAPRSAPAAGASPKPASTPRAVDRGRPSIRSALRRPAQAAQAAPPFPPDKGARASERGVDRERGPAHAFPMARDALAAAPAPLLGRLYFFALSRKKENSRCAMRALDNRARGDGKGAAPSHKIPPLLSSLRSLPMDAAIARPTAPSSCVQHETGPGDGRLGQHARHRRRAEPPGRGADAAKAFVAEQPENVRIGVVAFAGTRARAGTGRATRTTRRAIDAPACSAPRPSAAAISSAAPLPNSGIEVATFNYDAPRGRWPGPTVKPVPPASYNSPYHLLTDRAAHTARSVQLPPSAIAACASTGRIRHRRRRELRLRTAGRCTCAQRRDAKTIATSLVASISTPETRPT